jgi:transposase
VDEAGFNEFYSRQYAYSRIGTPVYGEVPGRKLRRTNVVAGYYKHKLVGKMLYEESMTSKLFENWFEKILLPEIPRKSFIIMDNAPFHNKKALRTIGRKKKCRVIFLPAYSPDLNDIEPQWANAKRKLRKNAQHHPTFFNALIFNL